jgi:hypothetical protein
MIISSVHCIEPKNIGDMECSPFKYFKFYECKTFDLRTFPNTPPYNNKVIIGGGGLLGSAFINPIINITNKLENVIIWGAGFNVHYGDESDLINNQLTTFLNQCKLIGIRDYGLKYEWVPCSSCMNPLFLKKYNKKYNIVIFEHKDVPIDIKNIPKIKNNASDIYHVISFIGSADVVITNSYHGVYWATLLNKKVLTIPFSSRFDNFKHKPTICTIHNWKEKLEEAKNYPEAIHECREANLKFFVKVDEFIRN